MTTTDDAVRERHGCACREAPGNSVSHITVWETDFGVHLSGSASVRDLTPWQARYLASKLYRLARRIRQRSEETA